MSPVRVLIVDDHDGFLAAATALLTSFGFEVVGSAADGESTVDAVLTHHPDLVLVDLQLPGIDGVDVAYHLDALDPAPQVILVSSRDDAGEEPRVVSAPVLGFIAKRHLGADAIAALRA